MTYAEDDGSSFWFMTQSSDAPEASKFFQSTMRTELDWENHAATIEELADASFTIYIAEQKLGDLVLVPPRSCHQVVNSGSLPHFDDFVLYYSHDVRRHHHESLLVTNDARWSVCCSIL